MSKSSEMDFTDWLILSVIVGLLGYGPCASCFKGCGPTMSGKVQQLDGSVKTQRLDSKR